MPRPRLPPDKAATSGAALIHPGRFADRVKPKRIKPLGDPYAAMTESQKVAWAEFASELPWLNSSHRPLVRMASILTARMGDDPEMGISAMQTLSAILSKLGATPADETKVNHDTGDAEEYEDKFFGRPN